MIAEFLSRSADLNPGKVALICGGVDYSYAQLEVEAHRLANTLLKNGVEAGDRVGIWLENSAEAVIAIFGVLQAGAVFLPIHPGTKADKLGFILQDCGAKVLITSAGKRGSSPSGFQIITGADPDASVFRPEARGIDIDLAALIYTSGSTGKPKGVMLTHLNMYTAARSVTAYLENRASDVIVNVLPLSFDYGLYQLLMAFFVGATLVLEKSFAFPWALIETMQREKVTGLPLVPTIAAILLRMDLSRCKLPHLRYITNTAAALPIAHIQGLQAAFPDATLFSMYGLTECKRATYLPPEQLALRPGSVGRAIPNTEVYLVDDEGRRIAAGGQGELVVRGAHVMKGYWGRPAETALVLRDGPLPGEKVLHTGDLFRTDSEGFLYFVGRKDDIIKSRGEKVSPREVENVICAMPQIAEAAVIGVADDVLGEAVAAFVVPRPEAAVSAREIFAYCHSRMEDFMAPKHVTIMAALPKSPNGKVDRRALAAAE